MIVIGSDHGGFYLKEDITGYFERKDIGYIDVGTYTGDSVDYPDYAVKAISKVLSGECEKAILICGTGIGISIAANKFNGIRCALCCNEYMAKMSREHNDANVLALGGRVIGSDLAIGIVETWLNAEFSGELKHRTRISKIRNIEEERGRE